MEYDELNQIWSSIPSSSQFEDPFGNKVQRTETKWTMTLRDFMNDLFWRGTAQAGDGGVWEYGPNGRGLGIYNLYAQAKDSPIDFTLEGKQYKMKVVEAFNQNIEAGEKLWWMTKEYTDPSVPAPPKEWQYATVIEMTREGDPDVLRIYQTYGEPHGVWEWDLQKLGNPMAINQLRFK